MKKCCLVLLLAGASFAGDSAIAGRWMGYVGGMLHTWQFQEDGTFLHVWVAAGAGNNLLRQERGNYRVEVESIELSAVTSAAGVVAPDRDGRKSLVSGARSKAAETRRIRFKVLEPGKSILIDGIKMKPSLG